jgi:hypothetical protein
VVIIIFAAAQKNFKGSRSRNYDENGGNREGAATYFSMAETPVRSIDVKLVQPKNAPLGCIITGVQQHR